MDLIEGLQKELKRNKDLLEIYKEIPVGAFGAAMIGRDILDAEAALQNQDTVAMIRSLATMKQNK